MNTQDYSKLIDFRTAMINALPEDPVNSELEFEDMLTMMEVVIKVSKAINELSHPITDKTQMNAVMHDPNEASFRSSNTSNNTPPSVTQTFSKEDVLRGHDQTGGIDIEKQITQVNQQPDQPVNRENYIQPFPPTPQNSSYGTDLRNMSQYVNQQVNTVTPEVIPTPWEIPQDMQSVQLPSMSMYPPEVQMMLRDAMRFGNLQIVMTELGMIPNQYQQQ
jgi:DNA uptake protein ComE-like DNA-binding protein